MIAKKQDCGSGFYSLFLGYVPGRLFVKIFSTCATKINKYFYNKYINAERLNRFHKKNKHKMSRHFYVIGMPGKIHFLEPCIDMIHDDINLFIILNGVTKNEKKSIAVKYPEIPLFELKSLFNRPISHGEVINLLLEGNETNFGLIDHDLYIFNKDIFTRLDFQEDEYIAGPFALHNKKADITFPATFFLFINTKIVKKIMARYRIGAQIYSKIPSRLQPALKKMNLGYDNFLKNYLHYFDPFNLIFAMAAYEGYKAKILKMQKEDMVHLGGKTTDDLLHHPRKTQQLIESIQNKTKNSRK